MRPRLLPALWALALLASVGLFAEALGGWAYVDASVGLVGLEPFRPGQVGRVPFDWSPVRAFQLWDAWSWSQLSAGSWPLWQPLEGLGHPLLANGQAAPLNPLKWLAAGALAGPGVAAFLVLRWLLGGVGAWCLARALALGPCGAGLVAVAFSFQGLFAWHWVYPDLHAWVAMPWLAWAALALLRAPSLAGVGLLGVALGATACLGHAEGAVFAGLGGVALALGAWWAEGREGRAWPLAALLGALLLGVACSGAMLWPFLDLSREAHSYLQGRGASALAEVASDWPWWRVALSLLRHALGPMAWPEPWGFNAWATTVALALAPLGAWRGARPVVWGAGVLGLVGLGAMLLLPPGSLVAWPVPVPNAFYASPLLGLAIALLGGAGLEAWAEGKAGDRAWVFAPALGLALLAAFWAWGQQRLVGAGGPEPLGGFWLALAIASVLAVAAWRPQRHALAVAALALVLAWGEGAWVMRQVNPPRPGGYPTQHPAAQALRALGSVRVAGAPGTLSPNLPVALGLRSFGLMEAWMPPRLLAYWKAMGSHDGRVGTVLELQPGFSRALARQAGLGAVVAPVGSPMDLALRAHPEGFHLGGEAQGLVWHVASPAPRAQVFHQVDFAPEGVASAAERLAATPARWWQVALVEAPVASQPQAWPQAAWPPSPVRWHEDSPNRLVLSADLPLPGLLVVADQWDHGWVARVDGVPATLWPAQVAFRGLWLPAGRHEVVMTYQPQAFTLGLASSAGGLGVALLLVLLQLGRRRVLRRQPA